MFLKPPFLTGSALLSGLVLLLALEPARLQAQGDVDFDSIFQTPPPAGHLSGTPPLPPSAIDPFALPPAGSIPLGSASPPLTSPSTSAAEPLDDPFGTPAPESRQVRQLGPPPAPAVPTVQPPAVPAITPAQAPAAPSTVPPAASTGARQTLDEAQRAKYRALFPDMLPPADQSVSALTAPALATPPPAVQAVPAQPAPVPAAPAAPVQAAPEPPVEEGPAIGRAGALLTQEYHGQAKILPPLDLPPAREGAVAPVAAPAPAPASAPAPKPENKVGAKAPAPKAKAPSKGSQGGRAPAPAQPPPLARGSLALVNETGDPQVGAVYQSALSRLGYTILSGPGGGFGPGPAGQTVVYYRPGAQARARAVSRDIPGRKTMAEAPHGAAADIVVVLR
ncbi:MAG: LytR C-terminal domain-containing protein [Candidatus Adiutrix sp.]|nr:LytR C-terminal domain-containing protein [Candidatus Adiutrix sp.]